MRNRVQIAASCCALIGLLILAAVAWAGLPGAAVAMPEPIATRQSTFSIPFTLPSGTDPGQEPVEVRLYCSTDQGRNWAVAGRVEPKQSSFVFKAPKDGEYWFIIRTVDRAGRLKPENGRSPELRVIVDTLPPRLDLTATRSPTGEVSAHWTAVDPLIKADSIVIEYQAQGDLGWHPVSFEAPRDDPSRSTTSGDVNWRPATAGPMIVRAEIRDRAGNMAVTTATARDGQSAPALASPSVPMPGYTTPASAPVENTSPYNAPYRTQPSPTGRSHDGDRHDLTASTKPGRDRTDPKRTVDGATPGGAIWPADQFTSQPITGSGPALSRDSLAQDSAAARAVESRINPPVADRVVAPSDYGPPPTTAGRAGLPSAETNSPAPAAGVSGAANPFTQGVRAGERPYMVNSKKFALEYQVESVGASGISKIEIWGTRDGGRTWNSYGVEPARQGPVRVSVDSEGLYGFRITVRDGNGLGGRAPQSGDLPELWVGVDLTKPSARIVGAELGAGDHAGELIVRWEAADAVLAARPITLLFSDRQGGPWSTIAAGLENSGVYPWRFDNRVPDRVYLRLEVRDDAGNVGQFETQSPVGLDPSRPSGHLRTVQPAPDESGRVQTYQFYR